MSAAMQVLRILSERRLSRMPPTPALKALRRSAKVARKTARMHGTPIIIWKDGKVVAEKP